MQSSWFGYRTIFAIAIPSLALLYLLTWSRPLSAFNITSSATAATNYTQTNQRVNATTTELCTIESYNRGEWVHRPTHIKPGDTKAIEKAAGYQCASAFPHKCYLRNKHEADRARTILDYTWQPSCKMLPFDAKKFADHLADHPLLLVGDSITQLQYESLSCQLAQYFVKPKSFHNLTGGDPGIKLNVQVNKARAEIDDLEASLAYLRSDYLVRLDDYKVLEPFDDEGNMLSKGHNLPWMHMVPKFDYILINTGPHWRSDLRWGPHRSQEELYAGFVEAMQPVLDRLKEVVQPHQRVWLRSSPFGHETCSQYTEPQSEPVLPQVKPYEWNMFEKYNQVFKSWVQDLGDDRFHYFDVSFTNLRGDAHSRPDKDCLHTCLPGPVDDWSKLLYHEIAKMTAGDP